MLLEELIEDERAEAKAEGRTVILKLMSVMVAEGRKDDILRLEDDAFFQEMCMEYHIGTED